MRISARTKTRLCNILKIGALALCFALVFSAALSAALTSSATHNISEADTPPISKGTQPDPIKGSVGLNYGTIFSGGFNPANLEKKTVRDKFNPQNVKFPQVQSSDGTNADHNNGLIYAEGAKISDTNLKSLYAIQDNPDTYYYKFGLANSVNNYGEIALAIPFFVPLELRQVLQSIYFPVYQITVHFEYTAHGPKSVEEFYVDCILGTMSAQDTKTLTGRNQYGSCNGGEVQQTSPTRTLTGYEEAITLAITVNWTGKGRPTDTFERWARIKDITAVYELTPVTDGDYIQPTFSYFDMDHTTPYRMSGDNRVRDPWPLYADGLESTLENAIDVIDDAGVNMHSYTNVLRTPIKQYDEKNPTKGGEGDRPSNHVSDFNYDGATDYYKKVKFYVYAPHAVKTITFLNQTIDVWDKFDRAGWNSHNWTQYTQIWKATLSVNGKAGVRLIVRKSDDYTFEITLYAYDNFSGDMVFNVYNASANYTLPISVTGIDTTATTNSSATVALDSGNANLSAAQDINTLTSQEKSWIRDGKGLQAYLQFTDNEGITNANVSRLAIYYTAKKFETVDEMQNCSDWPQLSKEIIAGSGYQPLLGGPSSASSNNFKFMFSYDFDQGTAFSAGEHNIVHPLTNEAKGEGYYAFRFWAFDLAGNEGAQLDQIIYAKVDYKIPEYTLNFTYKPDSNPLSTETITSDKNGAWATGETTLSFVLNNKRNISGNTIRFSDNNRNGAEDHFVSVDKDGKITHVDGKPVDEGAEATLLLTTNLSTPIEIVFKMVEDTFEITFKDNDSAPYIDVDWRTAFTVYAGGGYAVDSASALDTRLSYVNPDWKYDGQQRVFVGVDRNLPEKPYLTPDDQYLVDVAETEWNYDFDKVQRNWFTSSYTYTGALTDFNDDLIMTYGRDMRVNIGVKYVATREDLTSLQALDLEGKFASRQFDKSWFDGITYVDGFSGQTDRKRPDIDLVTLKAGGLRVLFVWAEDQAGNRSTDFSLYYILADMRNYSTSVSLVTDLKLPANTARAALSKTRGVKRGDLLTLTLTLSSGYVPFKLDILSSDPEADGSNTTTALLSNYTPNLEWTLAADAYGKEFYNGEKFVTYADPRTVQLRFDTPDSFAQMPSTAYRVSHRRVVVSNLVKERVNYTRKAVDLTDILTFDPEAVRSEYIVVFLNQDGQILYEKEDGSFTINEYEAKLTDGKPTYFIPKNVGEYKIRVYLDKENTAYVDDEFTMDEDGNQTFRDVVFNIDQAVATITPNATESVYGTAVTKDMLSYKVTYLVGADVTEMTEEERIEEGLTAGDLKLEGVDMSAILDAGMYAIVQDTPFEFAGGNYRVQFVEGVRHTVKPRQITVSTWDDSKIYGDADPVGYPFAVAQNQFDGGDGEGILRAIFGELQFETKQDGEANYYVCALSSYISREAGENAGQYNYINDNALFDGLNQNYDIVVDNTLGHFTVTQRTVQLDVAGQSIVMPSGTTSDTFDRTLAKLTYALAAQDVHLSDEISSIVQLALEDTDPTESSQDGFEKVYTYTIKLESEGNDNIKLTLGEDKAFIVYVANGKAVIISLKENADFGFVFGMQWGDDSLTYEQFRDLFEVTCAETPDIATKFDDITWTVTLSAHTNVNEVYIGAGSYVVTLSDIKIMNGGEEAKDENGSAYNAFANTFQIVIKPATITVSPSVSTWEKIYGQEDGEFGISFDITQINGKTFTSEDTFAGYDYMTIRNTLRGAFARGRYTSDGQFSIGGARYDDATNSDGTLLSPDSDGAYYALYVANNFASSDHNFAVNADLGDTSKHFVINPYGIELIVNDFVGRSKSYDDTTQVPYPTVRDAYDVSQLLARSTDDVTIAFNAEYLSAGNSTEQTQTGIKFTNIGLAGTKAHNYTISGIKIENSDDTYAPELYRAEGDEVEETTSIPLTDTVYVVIYYIDNNSFVDRITISAGSIALKKSDFIVSKPYDNEYTLDKSAIIITDTTDENGVGPRILCANFENAILIEEESSDFSGRDVGDRYIVTISLFFPIGSRSNFVILNDSDPTFKDDSITIEDATVGGVVGIKVVVANITARITQRILDATSFASIEAVDRDYNSKNNVESVFEFAQDALAVGDTALSVGVTLQLEIEGEDFGVGDHNVKFSADSSVVDKNYRVLIDDENDENALNKAYSGQNQLSVHISPAKLMPNVAFEEKDYDATTTVNAVQAENYSTMPLTTLNFSEDLEEELKQLSIDGEVNYTLSAKGKADANVAVDEHGNAIGHNVLVNGLKVQGDADILKNYVIYGERYDSENGYEQVGEVLSDDVIADYEIIGAAVVNKKSFAIQFNDINIQDHVYDGTPNAIVTANIPDNAMVVEEHKNYFDIYVTGTFKDKQVGNNITVVLSNVYLVVKQEFADDYGYLANNYYLEPYSGSHTANIVARPVAFSADLGAMVYNGSASIASANINYSLDGILPAEQNEYSVKMAGGANFIDPYVALDADGNVVSKDGAIFAPTLSSNKGRNNYVLTFRSEDFVDDTYVAVKDNDDNWYYYDEAKAFVAATLDNVSAYYYLLPTASKFINAQNAEAVERAGENIIGRYTFDGQDYYAVKADYESTVPEDIENSVPQATYFTTSGTIEQRPVTFDDAGVTILKTDNFEKVFDGTTKFFGKLGEDYQLSANSVRNVVEGDVITIDTDKVDAHFDSSSTTALYVLFDVVSIKGEKSSNYKVSAAATLRYPATIKKREVVASLKDGEMPYGGRLNFVPQVEYSFAGSTSVFRTNPAYPDSFFIEFAQFCKIAFGEDVYKEGVLDNAKLEEKYIKELTLNTYQYNAETDVYTQWTDGSGAPFEFFRIDFTRLPVANIEFSVENPEVGATANRYDFADMGASTNYAFVAKYTGSFGSTLTVKKKVVYAAADGAMYHQYYSEAAPDVRIVYFDETGDVNKGFVTGQTAQDLFVKGGVNYAPVVVWKILNDNGTLTDAAKYPILSRYLGYGQRYVAVLQAPTDVNYDTLGTLVKNYEVRFMDSFRVEDAGDGTKVITPLYQGNSIGNVNASELNLELNSIQGMSMTSSREGTYTWDGKEKAAGFIAGTQAGDAVTIGGREAKDAGEYSGFITVRRPVKIDANDKNNYYMEWTSQDEFKITINKADPGLTAASVTSVFTGNAYSYDCESNSPARKVNLKKGLTFNPKYIRLANDKYFVLEKLERVNDKDVYREVDAIRDAGKYRITVTLNEQFAAAYKNYACTTAVAYYTVTPVSVTVNISEDGYKNVTGRGSNVTRLSARYEEGKTYSVAYTITANNDQINVAADKISLEDTQCAFEREIDGPGVYPFKIVMSNADKNAGNYLFIGCDGTIELTAITVDNGVDSLTFTDKGGEPTDGVVANRLLVRKLVQATGNADDVNFYNKVAAYMPYIRRTSELPRTPKLAGVYRISLLYNNNTVGIDGNTVKISVAIPTDIDSMDDIVLYVSTAEGGLAKLTDYTVNDGKVEYSTDFLGALVFVDISPDVLPTWLMYTIIACGAIVGTILLWTLAAFVIRKIKNKKLV